MSAHPQERLSAFLDGELEPGERAQVQQHLETCDACAQELSELALVDRMGRELEVAVPEGYVESLPSRLRPRLRAAKKRGLPAWVLALAAVMLIGVLIPIAWRQHPPEAPASVGLRAELEMRAAVPAPSGLPTQAAPPLQKPVDEAWARVAPEPAAVEPRFAPPPRPAPTGAPPEEQRALRETLDDAVSTPQPAREAAQAPPATLGAEARQRGFGLAGGARDQAPAPASAPTPESALGRVAPPPPAPPPAAAPAPAPAGAAKTTTGGVSTQAPSEEAVEQDAEESPARRRADTGKDAFAKEEQPRLGGKARQKAATNAQGFAQVAALPLTTAAEARQARRAWREFAERHPQDPLADEGRARAVEAASLAYRLSGERSDRKTLEDDVRAYLARGDAAHQERVRALAASPTP